MAIEAILDASALLTLLQKETGSERVAQLIGRCGMSAVSRAEVRGAMADAGLPPAVIVELLDLSIEILPVDEDTANLAGDLLPLTAHRGLTLSDRCSLATAYLRDVPVLTSDRDWRKLNLADYKIEII